MGRKRHTAEQIIAKLREAEVGLAKGQALALVVRKLEISEQTYYRWRKEYGGLRVDPLASTYGRDGYRRITALLRREGWRVNTKRVARIWREQG